MNISKRKQGILAIICTIAMIVTSITVYNPREVKADSSATVDGKQYSATVKDGGEWTGFACQGIFDSARIHFAWGIDVDPNTITASIGETKLKVDGKSARGMNIPLSDVTSLEAGSYDIVINATTVASKSAEAKKISATATLKIEKVEGTTAVKKPSAPVGLVANMNDIKTNYTIAFGNVATATSYKFYLDGTYKKDITNGGIVTIEELGLEAGKTYKFGVSAVNAAGESDITTIDVKVPGKEEETTTGSSTKPLDPSTIKDSEWKLALNSKTVSYYIDGKADKVSVNPQLEGDNYYIAFSLAAKFKSVTFDGVSKDVEEGAFCRVKASDLTSGYHTLVVTDYHGKESVTIYFKVAGEEGTTKYTVSIDGTEKQYEEGATITVPADGQGYYDAEKKVAYAPEEVITVDRNITVTSIRLNVAMESGAGIKLTTPTGLRFKTNVTGTTDILSQSDIIKTGTIITASDILDGGTVDDNFVNSNKLKLNIENENNGWYGNTVGTFCASIVELQKENYARDFVGVGYVTIKYNNKTDKTIYAPSGTVRAVATVAQNIQKSEAIYQDGKTYYNYLKSLNKDYGTIIDTYAAAKKNNQ